jgi:CBS domain containing-hemolysin-like protein
MYLLLLLLKAIQYLANCFAGWLHRLAGYLERLSGRQQTEDSTACLSTDEECVTDYRSSRTSEESEESVE